MLILSLVLNRHMNKLGKYKYTCLICHISVCQVSTTVETFQDLSLPIPGKEDLAKLHSSIHQNLPVKTGVCPDTYISQGWISYIMDSIRRSVALVCSEEVNKFLAS